MTGQALVFLGSNVPEAADATASKTHGLVGWLLLLRKQESSYCWDVVGGKAEKSLQKAALQRPPRVSFPWQPGGKPIFPRLSLFASQLRSTSGPIPVGNRCCLAQVGSGLFSYLQNCKAFFLTQFPSEV